MGAWAPLVPYVKNRLGVDEGTLGLLLLAIGIGSMSSMSCSGVMAEKYGCKKIIVVSTLGLLAVLPMLASINNIYLMACALFLFGAFLGLTDVTMNIHATIVEKLADKPLMSGFHGFFSIGGIVGAAFVSALLFVKLSTFEASALCSIVILVLLFISANELINKQSDPSQAAQNSHNKKPDKILMLIAVICFICFMAEGAVLDWSGVYLTQEKGLDIINAGWGYAVFGFSMAVVRFFGDAIVKKFSRVTILIVSALTAALGYGIAVFFLDWYVSIFGFVLIGIGAANIVPIIITLAGKSTNVPVNAAIAFVTTVGYIGILLGPAAIGFIADIHNLSVAFIGLSIALILIAGSGLFLKELY